MKLKNKKIVLFLENQFQDAEVIYPYYRMIEEGAEVHLVAPKQSEAYQGKYGYTFKSDLGIGDIQVSDYDALIIPGGFAPDYMRRNDAMVDFVKQMNKEEKIIAAICHGGWMLASAEIIEGREVTTYSAISDDLRHAGANVVDKEVVEDGNIITSRYPADLPAFCRTIINALSS